MPKNKDPATGIIDGAVARNYKGRMEDFYRISAIPKANYSRWKNSPSNMKIEMLRRIDRTAHLTDEEIVGIVRGKKGK